MSVKPYDEEAIQPTDKLIRRINPIQHIEDDNFGGKRLSTKAFSTSSTNGGMSVDIESLMINDHIDPVAFVTNPTFIGSVYFSAEFVRSLVVVVGYNPIEKHLNHPDNPYHGEVWSTRNSKRFSGSEKRKLLQNAEWYVQIPDIDLP